MAALKNINFEYKINDLIINFKNSSENYVSGILVQTLYV